MREVLEGCRAAAGTDALLTWVPDEFLLKERVGPYSEMPLWIPDGPEHAGFNRVSIQKALWSGLAFRPLAETVRDTLTWDASLPGKERRQYSLATEREAELLARWNAARSAS
jgi:2'-hydroxyisoflavone reductase